MFPHSFFIIKNLEEIKMIKNFKKNKNLRNSKLAKLEGNLTVEHGYFFLKLDSRPLYIEDDKVSSMSYNSSNLAKVAAKMKNLQSNCPYLRAIVSLPGSSQKIIWLSNFKAANKAGNTMLRMNISPANLNTIGNYAEKSISWLDSDLSNKNVSILCIGTVVGAEYFG